MSSPFPPNALLTFTIDTTPGLTEDWDVVCYLKPQTSKSVDNTSIDGGDLSQIPLGGRIVGRWLDSEIQPIDGLPDSIKPGALARARVSRSGVPPSGWFAEILATGTAADAIEGDFYVSATIGSPWGVDLVLGAAIAGVLVTTISWGSSAL